MRSFRLWTRIYRLDFYYNTLQHGSQLERSLEKQEYWHNVFVQTFFNSPQLVKYFTVKSDTDGDNVSISSPQDLQFPSVALSSSNVQEHNEGSQTVAERLDAAEAEANIEIEAQENYSAWQRETAWEEHLAGSNLKQLAAATFLPDSDHFRMSQIGNLVEESIRENRERISELTHDQKCSLEQGFTRYVIMPPILWVKHKETQKLYASC